MDLEPLARALSANRRRVVRIDPDDPVMLIPQLAEKAAEKALAAAETRIQKQIDEISALHVQAENSAARRGEKLVLDAGAWGEQRIKTAADEAAARYVAETRKGFEDAARQLNKATNALWFAISAAGCLAIAMLGLMWLR